MNAPAPHGRPARVLSGGHRGLALAFAALLLGSPAFAQDTDGGKGKEPKKAEEPKKPEDPKKAEEPKKKTEEEKLLEALGASWKAGDAKAVAARFPAKRKVSLRIPGADAGDYRAEQAKSLLEAYFAGRSFTKVELKSVKEMTGTFQVEYVRAADRKTVKAEVLLVLGTEEKIRVLVGVREGP